MNAIKIVTHLFIPNIKTARILQLLCCQHLYLKS